jgi:hypothetical protein
MAIANLRSLHTTYPLAHRALFLESTFMRDESGSGDWTGSSNLSLGDAGRSPQSMSQSQSGDPRLREACISMKKHR